MHVSVAHKTPRPFILSLDAAAEYSVCKMGVAYECA